VTAAQLTGLWTPGHRRDCCGNVPDPGVGPHLHQGTLLKGNMETFDWELWLLLLLPMLWSYYAARRL
jgi:hypothetical protein